MNRGNIPLKEIKLLSLQSGGICAFPGCGKCLVEPGTAGDEPVVLGEIAHIVAESRQGPRGATVLTGEERNKHTNLMLLCADHHKVIDSQPNTYSVAVLRQMKADHEVRIRKVMSPASNEPPAELKPEIIHSTFLAITHVPAAVFSATCEFSDNEEEELRKHISYPDRQWELVPFLLRDKKLFAFHNLKKADNPFASVVDSRTAKPIRSADLWDDPEGRRRYVTLLNRSLYKYTARLGIRYDPAHYRFYFPLIEDGKERVIDYRPLNAKRSRRKVAWRPTSKATGEGRNFWWHLAAGLRFHQLAEQQWCLSIRPERHLTKDGKTPLPPERIGRRVTRLKAHMYNDLYLGEVNFWRDYLSRGQPRFILDFREQSVVLNCELLAFNVFWPGIPGDDKPFRNLVYEEDLFSFADLAGAVAGEDIDWEEEDDEAEKMDEKDENTEQ